MIPAVEDVHVQLHLLNPIAKFTSGKSTQESVLSALNCFLTAYRGRRNIEQSGV
ncbi:hypothetical protein BGX38DRAFT_1152780 [Terfezia claveryi]|nr:hypothetical protein BGX38DRAFT_1152780 [Terfezia claveryi]